VFRVALFSIVLTLIAPQGPSLCKLWCQPSDAATIGCHHHDQAPSVVQGDDSCGVSALDVPTFVREDGPRVSTRAAQDTVPVSRYQVIRPASERQDVAHAARARALERRPLDTTLRL
jgi:hypothetical protein